MLKIALFAVAAAATTTGFGVWATAPTNARVPSTVAAIEPVQLMTNTKALSTEDFTDYTFVFVH
jgi:hypothetical protein